MSRKRAIMSLQLFSGLSRSSRNSWSFLSFLSFFFSKKAGRNGQSVRTNKGTAWQNKKCRIANVTPHSTKLLPALTGHGCFAFRFGCFRFLFHRWRRGRLRWRRRGLLPLGRYLQSVFLQQFLKCFGGRGATFSVLYPLVRLFS